MKGFSSLMGWYIRKSKNIGPIRVNLSKSGLGISGGVKGFRISKGPKGTYLNAGRNGIYYRKKLDSSNRNKSKTNRDVTPHKKTSSASTKRPYGPYIINNHLNGSVWEKAKPDHMPSLVFLYGIIASFILTIIFVNNYVGNAFAVISMLFIMGLPISLFFNSRAVLMYDLSNEDLFQWNDLCNSISVLEDSNSVAIELMRPIHNKSRYYYNSTLQFVEPGRRKRIKTNIESCRICTSDYRITFFPDGILITGQGLSRFCRYNNLRIETDTKTTFSTIAIDSDAEIRKVTWEHSNKDGSKDHRYNDNRCIVHYLYKSIVFNSIDDSFSIIITPSKRGTTDILFPRLQKYLEYASCMNIQHFTSIKQLRLYSSDIGTLEDNSQNNNDTPKVNVQISDPVPLILGNKAKQNKNDEVATGNSVDNEDDEYLVNEVLEVFGRK